MCNMKVFLVICLIGSMILTAGLAELHAGPIFHPKIRITPSGAGHQLNLGSKQLFVPPTSSLLFRSSKDGVTLDIYDHEGKLSTSLKANTFDYHGKSIASSPAGNLNIHGQIKSSGFLVKPLEKWTGSNYPGSPERIEAGDGSGPPNGPKINMQVTRPDPNSEEGSPVQEVAAGAAALTITCLAENKLKKRKLGEKVPFCKELLKDLSDLAKKSKPERF